MMKGINRVNVQKVFPRMGVTVTRGHAYKIQGVRYRRDGRGRFFTQRVVEGWNKLPAKIVEATSLGAFKGMLDKHMDGRQV